ncbi:PTS fructose transporter subunit IIABC [Anaeromicropila herbilytica]|nr:PTS fructose transporter subunit IIABC [Anaeromicropila herbilytica]
MRITSLLKQNAILLDGKVSSKDEAIDKMIELMSGTGNVSDVEEYKRAVLQRESEGSTGIGEGIAIPHAKTSAVKQAGLSAMVVRDGVDFDSLDGAPVTLVFLIAAPNTKDNVHLDVLSRLSVLLMDETFTNNLRNAKSINEFLQVIDEAESKKFPEEKVNSMANGAKYRVLAVTACPTGIAHTFMAAESLETKAREKGITIKVETNGSGGAKNVLTKEDIAGADCIIVAADKKVDMARFDGKRVIQTKVANGIHKASELIDEAVSGNAPIYHSDERSEGASFEGEQESIGRQIYKHLMNGVSHMLPFVIGGGILIALAFLLDDYSIKPSNFGSNTPVAAFFKSIGGGAFGFMLPILAGYIAMSIGDRPALAVGVVGGYIASQGGSAFFGALIAGFAAGYLVVGLRKLFSFLPQSLEGIKPVLIYPFFGILIIGVLMTYAINPPLAELNKILTDALNGMSGSSKLVLGLILGGMMSIDFGGPINKTAYVFGTASLASGNFDIMAAVMIGGMTPPLAIAVATLLFKNRFTKRERESGITNFVMGLAFITEGAIPFAAADPLRVIPSLAIGSAISGALSMVFGCTLRAPHGGVFVFPVVGNAGMYIVALVIGTLVGSVLLGLLKKPVEE